MTHAKTIFEIRRHPLLSAILIGVILATLFVVNLIWGDISADERVYAPAPWGVVVNSWQVAHPIWAYIIVWCGVSYIAFKLGHLVSRFNIYGTKSFLPIEIYPLLAMGVMVNVNSLNGVLASVLLVRSISRFFSSYRASNSSGFLVRSALSLGVILMLVPASITLWFGIFPILLIMDRTLREVIVTFIALLFVPFIYMYIGWLQGADFVDMWDLLISSITHKSGFSIIESFTIPRAIVLVLVLYLTITGMLATPLLENSVKAQRRLRIVAIFAICIGAMSALPSADSSLFMMLSIPLSLLIPITLLRLGRIFSFILYVVLFLASAVVLFS